MGFIKHFADSGEGEVWPSEHLLRKEKRDKFLEENPHMKKYQTEIEKVLNRCNSKDRMEVLSIMLGCKLNEFADQLYELKDINQEFIK